MNAWRCNDRTCHHLFTDDQISDVGNLKTCPICGCMVCDVTHTKVGEEFIAKQNQGTPASIGNQYLNKVLSVFPA